MIFQSPDMMFVSQGEQAKQQDDWMKLGGENQPWPASAIIPKPWHAMDHDFQKAVKVTFPMWVCLKIGYIPNEIAI